MSASKLPVCEWRVVLYQNNNASGFGRVHAPLASCVFGMLVFAPSSQK